MCPGPLDDGAGVAPQGLEPRLDEPESSVLPLDDGAKHWANYKRTLWKVKI